MNKGIILWCTAYQISRLPEISCGCHSRQVHWSWCTALQAGWLRV